MHYRPEDIPALSPESGNICFRSVKAGDSGMELGATYVRGPADIGPLYKGLPGDTCPCDHFGYVVEGSFLVRYTDGSEERVSEGEVYYIPKGHSMVYEGPCHHVEFNLHDQLQQLLTHTATVVARIAADADQLP